MKYLFILFLFGSCAAAPRAPENGLKPGAKEAVKEGGSVEITASSRAEDKRPFRLKLEGSGSPTLAEDEELRQVDHALRADGYGPHHLAKPLEVRVKFSKEPAAIQSFTFGMLGSSFKHEVSLQAFTGEELLWETTLVANSAAEDVRPILSSMLAAGLGFYGKNSAGKKTVPLVSAEVAEKQFALPPARRGLLQR